MYAFLNAIRARCASSLAVALALLLCSVGCGGGGSQTATFVLTITLSGTGSGVVTSDVGGVNCGPTCTTTLDDGTVVTLTATPAAGSVFSGWSGGASGTGNAAAVTMSAATAVTATFTVAHVLTIAHSGTGTGLVTSDVGGINCGVNCSGTFAEGSVVTLTAVPVADSVFTGWSGGGASGTGTAVVTMNGATTVTANFEQTFTLTVIKAGSGTGIVTSSPGGISCGATCSATFVSGTVVTLIAFPSAGSAFAGWSGGCVGTGTCNVTMTGATTVTAIFN